MGGGGSRGPKEGDRPARGMSGSANESLEAVHAFLGGERAQPLGVGVPRVSWGMVLDSCRKGGCPRCPQEG